MKKFIFLLLAIISCFSSYSQGQHRLRIVNNTNCNIAITAYAYCNDGCDYYGSFTYTIAANSSFSCNTPLISCNWDAGSPFGPCGGDGDWHWEYMFFSNPCYITTSPGPSGLCGFWDYGYAGIASCITSVMDPGTGTNVTLSNYGCFTQSTGECGSCGGNTKIQANFISIYTGGVYDGAAITIF